MFYITVEEEINPQAFCRCVTWHRINIHMMVRSGDYVMLVMRCRRGVEPELTERSFSLAFCLSVQCFFVVSFNIKHTKNILLFPKEDL